jgi:hypothetical protein
MNAQPTRPFAITLLGALAFVALGLSVLHFLQALGIIPYFIGAISFRDFSLWYALMWALMVWVWWWVGRAILMQDPSAWLFLLLISGFNLIFVFVTVIFSPSATTDLSVSFLLNLAIFGYTLLPSTKRTFGVDERSS